MERTSATKLKPGQRFYLTRVPQFWGEDLILPARTSDLRSKRALANAQIVEVLHNEVMDNGWRCIICTDGQVFDLLPPQCMIALAPIDPS